MRMGKGAIDRMVPHLAAAPSCLPTLPYLRLAESGNLPAAQLIKAAPDGTAPYALHRRRVLVVDDEQLIADTLTSILNLSGFDARAVYSGEQALEAVPDHCPDIVLTDVRMPGRNGIETGREILKHCPHIRVVLFSGQANVAGLMEAANQESNSFELWSKPLHPKDLVRRLRAL